jgi:IrrE N-terminal-like domain
MERTSDRSASAWDVIRERVLALQCEASFGSPAGDILLNCARLRNIVTIEEQEGLSSDGFIEPLGSSLANGFRVVLRKDVPSSRQRFTLAHEICHTFFYEAAPELKFSVYKEDSFEEALCNYGASCLLVPESALRESSLALRPCLPSLETLSDIFKVSHETMVVRLRSLGLWKCEYSLWHKMTGGEFVIDKLYGWKRIDWNWSDPVVLHKAWCSGRLHRGETVLWWETSAGYSTGKSVHYEIKRRGDLLVALWDERKLYERLPPLLTVKKRQRKAKRAMPSAKPRVHASVEQGKRYWWTE